MLKHIGEETICGGRHISEEKLSAHDTVILKATFARENNVSEHIDEKQSFLNLL